MSISQVFFAFGLTVLIIYGWALYGGIDIPWFTRLIYGLSAIIFLVLSYLAFDRVEAVDFWDFVAGMIFTGELRKYPHGKAVDMAAAQLYFGLVLVAVAPIFLRLSGPSAAAGFATLGGLLIATGVAEYVLSGTKLRP